MALDVKVKKMVLNFTEEKSELYVASAQRGKVVEHKSLVKQVAYEYIVAKYSKDTVEFIYICMLQESTLS